MLEIRKYMDMISISFEEMILQMKKASLKERRLAVANSKKQRAFEGKPRGSGEESGISQDEDSLASGSEDSKPELCGEDENLDEEPDPEQVEQAEITQEVYRHKFQELREAYWEI